jgi:hypothetical protein
MDESWTPMHQAWPKRVLLFLVCVALGACPAPRDRTPQIRVAPGAAARYANLLDRSSSATASHTASSGASARVHVMRSGEELGGPNAIGRPGDLVLENDEVAFVIDQLGSSPGFAESGGNLVDAADARARKDELGQVFTYFGAFPRQGVYDALSSGAGPEGSAWVEARGKELREPRLVVTTRHSLQAHDRALLMQTSIENTGDSPIVLPSLGDAIQWGGAEKVAPGKPIGFKGGSSGPYIGGVGRFTSYAVTSTEGAIDGTSGSGWTDTAQRRQVTLGPHEKASFERIFVVGERPDTSSLVGELALAAGAKCGSLEVTLPDPATLATGAVVTLLVDGSRETLTVAAPFVATLPVGRYSVLPMAGTSSIPAASSVPLAPIEIRAAEQSHVDLPAPHAATLDLRCQGPAGDPIPCKVTFVGEGVTPTPNFGPAHAAGPARNQATSSTGAVRVALAPGKYAISASRGPEYALASSEVELAAGEARLATLTLRRVVDTQGYVACDFHQHSMFSADAPVAARDRVIANAAEGVEVAVASEHNVVVDLEPLVKELGLEHMLVEIAGDELTSDADRHPWGHANFFPMVFDPAKLRGGAPALRDPTRAPEGDLSPKTLFDWLRKDVAGEHVVQVNHPRSGSNGYFDLLKFDRALGRGSAPFYDDSFDAVEVWNGRNVDARAEVLDDWRALLRTGHVVTPTANTDTHGIVGQEAGYPRTYVRVADDAHLEAWNAARTDDLVRGVKERRDVVLTNGPMLRARVNGAPIGGVARVAGGHLVTVEVHVECAPWVDVDTVRVIRASEPARDDHRAVKLAPLPGGALGANVTFVLRVDGDDALFVVASGTRLLSPILGGDGRELAPWAMTGAIWVDADGDGRALGR